MLLEPRDCLGRIRQAQVRFSAQLDNGCPSFVYAEIYVFGLQIFKQVQKREVAVG